MIDRWDPSRGGAEAALAELAEGLEARGHAVLAFAAEGPAKGRPAQERWRRVRPAWSLGRSRGEKLLARALDEAAREAGCDVRIGLRHLFETDLWWPHGGCHRATLRALGKPLRGRHRVFVELEARMARSARRVACVSRLVLEEVLAEYPELRGRAVLVGSALDLERFHPRERATSGAALRASLGIGADEPLIGFSARQPRTKGLSVLLESFRALRAAGSGATLLVAGSAVRAEEHVRVLREVDPVAFAAACDLVCLPTLRDTFGRVVAEALACGTPVVTTARAGAAELLARPEQGRVLGDPRDTAALTEALAEGLALRPGRELVREAALACGRETWLDRMEALCRECAAGSNSDSPRSRSIA
ncbi:MAG: glycosyltransferase family 4 protein [Planctomycetes bacterium]|nr:glycosyltransferase family 4 protein [Planctomycetota bacterium]